MDNSIESNWQVSLQEYELFWAGHFKAQDTNKDGLIQAEEYPEQGVFNYFDANDDGTVNLEEYQKVYAYHFNKFDQENTGVLLIREMDFRN
jgi:hypothetical protein